MILSNLIMFSWPISMQGYHWVLEETWLLEKFVAHLLHYGMHRKPESLGELTFFNATICFSLRSTAFHTIPYAPLPSFSTISYFFRMCGSISYVIYNNYYQIIYIYLHVFIHLHLHQHQFIYLLHILFNLYYMFVSFKYIKRSNIFLNIFHLFYDRITANALSHKISVHADVE
jgi:hypothetical protein